MERNVDYQTRAMAVLLELHGDMPQQGPGDDAITREVLGMLPPFGEGAAILDAGCGSGRSTLVLAQETRARITAVDMHPPFVEGLRREAAARGFGNRIQAVVGDMAALDLPSGSLDLIWCWSSPSRRAKVAAGCSARGRRVDPPGGGWYGRPGSIARSRGCPTSFRATSGSGRFTRR